MLIGLSWTCALAPKDTANVYLMFKFLIEHCVMYTWQMDEERIA